MESTNTTPASEPKYQVKGTVNTPNPEEKKKSRGPRNGRGGNRKESDKHDKTKTIKMDSIDFEDYATHDEAAEAISFALSTYASTSAEAIRASVINYLKKQLRAGLKLRTEILAKGSIESPSVLTQCILSCEEFGLSGATHIFDYCIFFIYKMVAALRANEKSLLNRGSNGYLRIYYELTHSLFKIDTNVKRDEKDVKDEVEEKEEEDPKDSVFGSDKKLETYQDFKEYHIKWVKDLLKGPKSEFILFHVKTALGEDIKKEILTRSQELINEKSSSQQTLGIHYVEKYSLYNELDLMAICLDQAEQKNVENIIRLIGKLSKYEVEEKKKLQTGLIETLINLRNTKVADQLCGKFDIPLTNYPVLVDMKIRGAVRFFLGSFLRKGENEKDYKGLDKIENLFEDLNDCQSHLCEQLWHAGKKMEAKGVFDRSKLTAEEVNKVSNGKEVGT